MKKYSYLILMLITCLLGIPMAVNKIHANDMREDTLMSVSSKTVQGIKTVKLPEPEDSNTDTAQQTKPDNNPSINATVNTNNIDTTMKEESQPQETAEPVFTQVDRSYFTDALFIGDSRTMGLAEYADLGSADIFAGSGMSLFKLFESKNTVTGQQIYLNDMLTQKIYGKIYFMMGINDLGYDSGRLSEQYKTVITQIKKMQPETILILEANMHVTAQKSAGDTVYNNENINSLNTQIQALAKETGCIYLDVNANFDDADGALSSDLTHDEVHVLGKHYQKWADWICTKGVL